MTLLQKLAVRHEGNQFFPHTLLATMNLRTYMPHLRTFLHRLPIFFQLNNCNVNRNYFTSYFSSNICRRITQYPSIVVPVSLSCIKHHKQVLTITRDLYLSQLYQNTFAHRRKTQWTSYLHSHVFTVIYIMMLNVHVYMLLRS